MPASASLKRNRSPNARESEPAHSEAGAPTPEQIRSARSAAGLTQAQAAELVYLGAPVRWTEYESGTRQIDRARWALFRLRARLVTLRGLRDEG